MKRDSPGLVSFPHHKYFVRSDVNQGFYQDSFQRENQYLYTILVLITDHPTHDADYPTHDANHSTHKADHPTHAADHPTHDADHPTQYANHSTYNANNPTYTADHPIHDAWSSHS